VRDLFRRGGVEAPELDARLLAEQAFALTQLGLVTHEREPATPAALAKMHDLAARRLRGEPVVRILGEKEFYGLGFGLNAATLVPRPETELLVAAVVEFVEERKRPRILDLGTGSGCIGISILVANPEASVVAVDSAEEALAMAKANAERHGVGRRFETRLGRWYEPLKPRETFDVIVSNPPYIATAVIETLPREVRDFDPRAALDGGADGLDSYRAILAGARRRLRSEGRLVVEVGHDQGRAVKLLFEGAGLGDVRVEKDFAGLDRMVSGTHS
jgi:release factor glutamine methyltransferase